MTATDKTSLTLDTSGVSSGGTNTAAGARTPLTDARDLIRGGQAGVSADDTHVKHIEDVLSAGTGVSISKNNAGADETLTIARTHANNTVATTPTVNDDSGDGYAVRSQWLDTSTERVYICTNASAGAANWEEITNAAGAASDLDGLSDVSAATDTANQVLATPDGTPGDHVGRVLVMDDLPVKLPQHDSVFAYQMVDGGTTAFVTPTADTAQVFQFYCSAGTNRQFRWSSWLRAGTYDIHWLGIGDTDFGLYKFRYSFDGGAWVVVSAAIDLYRASRTNNLAGSVLAVSLPSDGLYVWEFFEDGKGGLSSGFEADLTYVQFRPNGGY